MSQQRAWPRAFMVLLVASVLTTTVMGAFGPMLSLYITDELAGGNAAVGATVAGGYATGLAGALLVGPVVDRRGRRLPTLVGLALDVVGTLGLLVAGDEVATLLARLVSGVGGGITSVTLMVWAIDYVDASRRGRALSAYGATIWIGLSIGPPAGQALLRWQGFDAVWLGLTGLLLLCALVVLALPDVSRPPAVDGLRPVAEPRRLRRWLPPGTGIPVVAIGLVAYGDGVLNAFLVLHLADRGVSESAAATVFTVFAGSVLAARLVGGGIVDRSSPRLLAAGGLLLDAAGLALIASASSFAVAAGGAVVMGVGFAVIYPALGTLSTLAAGPERHGAAVGAFSGASYVGLALGALVSGVAASVAGTGASLGTAVAAASAAAVLLYGATALRRICGLRGLSLDERRKPG